MGLERLKSRMAEFVERAEAGEHAEAGWPSTCYGVSKLGVIALTHVLVLETAARGVTVACCCPGYCVTDMSSHRGPRSAGKGARSRR